MKTCFLLIIVLSGLIAFMWLTVTPAASQSTPTPTPTPAPPRSLFEGDVCAPPCWFGLTPGVSTAQDVEAFFQRFDEIFYISPELSYGTQNPDTGYMVDGVFGFFWNPTKYERQDYGQHSSYLRVRQGIVNSIIAQMNRRMYLAEVLDTLGSPNYVVLSRSTLGPLVPLALVYPELHLRIGFFADTMVEACNTATVGESFWVTAIRLYDSPDIPIIASETEDRLVPPETWQAWLNGEVSISCVEAWRRLAEATPATPTGEP